MAEKISTLALGGMDALSYFENPKPRRGSFDFKTQLDGMTYCFSTECNRDRFIRRPEVFLPEFGGNCAFYCGLLGKLVPGTVKDWRLLNGKLYLLSGPNVGWLWDKLPMLMERGQQNYRAWLRGRPAGELTLGVARARISG